MLTGDAVRRLLWVFVLEGGGGDGDRLGCGRLAPGAAGTTGAGGARLGDLVRPRP